MLTGGTVSLNLLLSSSSGGQPAAFEWTFAYSTTDIVAIAASAGTAATAAGCLALLTLLFIQPLTRLILYASQSDLHSHILLVPFISGYLLHIWRGRLTAYHSSIAGTVAVGGIGIALRGSSGVEA